MNRRVEDQSADESERIHRPDDSEIEDKEDDRERQKRLNSKKRKIQSISSQKEDGKRAEGEVGYESLAEASRKRRRLQPIMDSVEEQERRRVLQSSEDHKSMSEKSDRKIKP